MDDLCASTAAVIRDRPLTDATARSARCPIAAELLGSSGAKSIISILRGHWDILVIDTPPLIPMVDGLFVAAYVDATLLVARHKLSTKSQIVRASSCGQVKAPLVGAVLNGATDRACRGYGYAGGAGPPPRPSRDGGGPPSPSGGGQPSGGRAQLL